MSVTPTQTPLLRRSIEHASRSSTQLSGSSSPPSVTGTPPSTPRSFTRIWDEGVERVRERQRSESSASNSPLKNPDLNRLSAATYLDILSDYQRDSCPPAICSSPSASVVRGPRKITFAGLTFPEEAERDSGSLEPASIHCDGPRQNANVLQGPSLIDLEDQSPYQPSHESPSGSHEISSQRERPCVAQTSLPNAVPHRLTQRTTTKPCGLRRQQTLSTSPSGPDIAVLAPSALPAVSIAEESSLALHTAPIGNLALHIIKKPIPSTQPPPKQPPPRPAPPAPPAPVQVPASAQPSTPRVSRFCTTDPLLSTPPASSVLTASPSTSAHAATATHPLFSGSAENLVSWFEHDEKWTERVLRWPSAAMARGRKDSGASAGYGDAEKREKKGWWKWMVKWVRCGRRRRA